jgi:hypothetical protein
MPLFHDANEDVRLERWAPDSIIVLAERMVEAGAVSAASTVPLTPQGKKLARDVLEDFMLRFAEMAEKEADPGKSERWPQST